MSKQRKNKTRFVVREDSPVGLRMAARFLIELGRPARFDNEATLTRWAATMDRLLTRSGLDFDEFRWFLIWATRLDELGNTFTATNLRRAADPGASLEKQFEVTYSIYSEESHARDRLREMLVRRRTEEDEEAEYDRIRAALSVPDDCRCPYCQYGEDGERTKWCRDCYDEANEPSWGETPLQWGECPECLAWTPGKGECCSDCGCVRCGKKATPGWRVCESCSEQPAGMAQ